MSNEAFTRKLNAQFWPAYEYQVFSKHLGETKGHAIGLLNELYEKRGDVYLRTGDFKSDVKDFGRIYNGIPIFGNILERWRPLGANVTGTYYLDVKTVQFPINGYAKIWLKTTGKSTSAVQAFEIDCRGRRLSQTSNVVYSPEGNVLRSSDVTTGWQPIVPDSMGEQLHNGLCN